MVNITLSNTNLEAAHRQVNINLLTGICTFDDQNESELKHLNDFHFSHPLLKERTLAARNEFYHYEYDNIEGLLLSAIYVYATLLQTEKPMNCQFKINPSPHFQGCNYTENLYFSINSQKTAQEIIQVSQLERFINNVSDFEFKFSEDILIDDNFSSSDLPQTINGDLLYKSSTELLNLLTLKKDFKNYELRYIDPTIGFGIFSRKKIKKGENIFFYTGIKTMQKPPTFQYTFNKRLDSLNMYLDARQHGNLTRFINHAPQLDSKPQNSEQDFFLNANIEARNVYINGLKFVLYLATREIPKGEQLLVDYGKQYFQYRDMSQFTSKGQVVVSKKRFRGNTQRKLNHLRLMANVGIRSAQLYFLSRELIAAAVIALFFFSLNYFLR